MPPSLALSIWLVLLLAVLRFDPAKNSQISIALWVPLGWVFLLGSRLPSQWLNQDVGLAADALQEGNSLDRSVSLFLIVLALGIAISRAVPWSDFLARNWAVALYVSYALISVCWSDFAFVAFKRWFRDLGNYLMVLVVLSDPHPLEAIRVLLRRLAYLLVPLCIVLIKYYPELAKHYDSWTGVGEYVGAATSKNTLGVVCLISGIFFFWDALSRWPEHRKSRTRKILLVNLAFFAMTIWILSLSNSATSRICLLLGCLVIATAYSGWSRRRPGIVKAVIPAAFCLFLVLSLGFNLSGRLASAVGRDPTLTDRTKIWGMMLGMHTNPVLGTGYESFWLGSRLEWIWSQNLGHINEAHNGLLEVYLNLGVIGLALVTLVMAVSYRTICKRMKSDLDYGVLGLAIWTAMVFHSVTEADFRAGLMWLAFLLASLTVRMPSKRRVHRPVGVEGNFPQPMPEFPLEVTGQWR